MPRKHTFVCAAEIQHQFCFIVVQPSLQLSKPRSQSCTEAPFTASQHLDCLGPSTRCCLGLSTRYFCYKESRGSGDSWDNWRAAGIPPLPMPCFLQLHAACGPPRAYFNIFFNRQPEHARIASVDFAHGNSAVTPVSRSATLRSFMHKAPCFRDYPVATPGTSPFHPFHPFHLFGATACQSELRASSFRARQALAASHSRRPQLQPDSGLGRSRPLPGCA